MKRERRRQRSDHYPRALRLQLAATAARARFSAVVLTGRNGMLLVGAGDAQEHQELALLARKLAPLGRSWQGRFMSRTGTRRVTITPLKCRLGSFQLCALGGDEAAAYGALAESGQGVQRILNRHCTLK